MSRLLAIRTLILAFLLGLIFVGQPVDVRAQSPNRAALVVSYAEGQYDTECVSFDEEEISGYELLSLSELEMQSVPSPGFGDAICRIGSVGCTAGTMKQCFCQCPGATCVYWSYWQLVDGVWTFSSVGASSTSVRNGSVDGWVWTSGTLNQGADRVPPGITFADVCPDATATPTVTATETQAAATQTPTATNTPKPDSPDDTPTPIPTVANTPTAGPTPTVTNTPFAPPTVRLFTVDRSPIVFGESVTLAWDVADSTQVLLRYPGVEESVPAQGSRVLVPDKSTQYSLFAASPVGQSEAYAAVEVNPVISAPTADPAAVSEAATDTAAAYVQVTPTEPWTPSPMPTLTPIPAATPVPTLTETPTLEAAVLEAPASEAFASGPTEAGATEVAIDAVPEDQVVQAPTAPPVVILAPVSAGGEGVVQSAGATDADRTFMAVGLAFLVGAPLMFGGIWLGIWLLWKRTP